MSSTQFNEADVRRNGAGEFSEKHQSAPELTLGGDDEAVIVNSAVVGERRANLWLRIPAGKAVEMNISEAAIGRPEENEWREDTIAFRRTDEGIRTVYTVTDDDINERFQEAFSDLSEQDADEMKFALRNDVRVKTFGDTDVFFEDGQVEFRHVADHDVDEQGGIYTANTFDALERQPSYVITRDGVLFPAAYAVLNEYGF
ncbi:hypothetical protein [Microbacterium sp. 77mftsu3.1]|uniref:hypothetical protein n=1 Tax=Microbacterium sp. 77mftsu3.1 TaxID=1761802 RepID=UPI00115FCA08|nr:hypothetical protein [Microbacterium sp. 77mftsu3.1]